MSVRLEDLILYEEDGETSFVSFDELYVNLAPWYLFSSELVIQELLLDGLKVNLIKYDSSFNFDQLIAFHTQEDLAIEDSIQADTTQSEPFKFHLSNLELTNGDFYYLDSVMQEDVNMVNLNLFVPYIGWNQEDSSAAGLKFFFANGGYFHSAIQLDPVTGNYNAEMHIDDLDLGTFLGYATSYLAIDTLQGSLNTFLHAKGNTNFTDSLSVKGWVNLSHFNLTSNNNRKLASIDSLYCSLQEIRPLMNRFLVDTLSIIQPFVSFELYDSTNNIMDLFTWMDEVVAMTETEDDSVNQEMDTTEYPLFYSLNNLNILAGEMTFTDHQYDSLFYYKISEFEMSADSISSHLPWIDLNASMILNNTGTIIAEAGFNPYNPLELDIQYAISEFRLSDLNIYMNHYVSHDIVFGDLYYNSDTKIRDGQIVSDNKLTIRDIEISKIEGGLTALPLKLALFIIKDKNGDAVLDIPVRGDLNDPSLTVSKLVWNTFKKFIVRVATSPFYFLAGLVSADPSDLKDIQFSYADTVFSPKIQRQLDLLLELEQKKEGLDIKLVYFVDMDIEKEEIAIKKAGEDFYAATTKDFRDHENEFLSYLQNRSQNDSLDISEGAMRLIDPVSLDSLAMNFTRYRVNQLQSYLLAKNDSTIIRVRNYHPEAPMNVGASPFFKVEYAIIGDED